jgi:hypothetical protein
VRPSPFPGNLTICSPKLTVLKGEIAMRHRLLIATAAIAGLMSGCGSTKDTSEVAPDQAATPTEAPAPVAAPTPAPVAAPAPAPIAAPVAAVEPTPVTAPAAAPEATPEPFATAEPGAQPTNGLMGEFFTGEAVAKDSPDIAADAKPNVIKFTPTVNFDSVGENFAGSGLSSKFFVRWTGVLKVPQDGKYTFFTESDDGSHLFIDGQEVVSNGGAHPMMEKQGEVELKAGDHPIKLELYQGDGGVGCKLSWKAEGMDKAIIPASALAPK